MSTGRAREKEREAEYREAEYRRAFLECALRLYCRYPDIGEAKALSAASVAASVFVAELRQHDGRADTQACSEKGPEPQDNLQPVGALPAIHPSVTAAIARYAEDSDGDIEVDLDAVVSFADGGAFVQMWGWVDNTWS